MWITCACMCCTQLLRSCLTLRNPGLQPSRLLCLWNFLGKNTAVGYHTLLRGIFPTQGPNLYLLHLLHCRQILSTLSHLGSPLWIIPTVKFYKGLLGKKNVCEVFRDFLVPDGKESACNADWGSVPGSGRLSGEENTNPLQYPCLESPMAGGP